jgi:ATP-dependent Zn protease
LNQHVKTILIWVVIISIVLILIRVFTANDLGSERIEQSVFYSKVDEGKIASVTMTGDAVGFSVKGQYKERTPNNKDGFTTYIVKDEALLKKMRDQGSRSRPRSPRTPR